MSIRSAYLLGFILVMALLLISVYVQFVDGILPCPLCSFQRATFGLLGIIFLIGLFTYRVPILGFIINILAMLGSVLGIILAGRQIWLQHHPSLNSECGVSLEYMMQTLPINEVVKKIFFEGTAECTERGWEFLYLNMAEWSLIWFGLIFILTILILLKKFKMNNHI